MKRSRRYIKKQLKKQLKEELINKKVLQRIIRKSRLCQHAINELKLAGYSKGEGGPNDWMYQRVLEIVAVFSSHGNSGMSAPLELDLAKKLCSWDIISPLRFTDDEWKQISADGTCQNKRKNGIFKEPNGRISHLDAYSARATGRYNFSTKEWTENKNPICWYGCLFEYKDNVFTGRFFDTCFLWLCEANNEWTPKPKRIIDCVKVEIAPDNWIMAVNADNTDLLLLSYDYDIQWKDCSCIKGVRLENVTPEIIEQLYNKQIQN